MSAAAHPNSRRQQVRAFWLKHLHQWHWISAAMCLVGLLLFSITGFTLNHASWIAADPKVIATRVKLPDNLLEQLRAAASGESASAPVAIQRWLSDELAIRVAGRSLEWSDRELYVSLPRPGGDAWLSIDLQTGDVLHEKTDRGWLAYLNDLHKGRHAGAIWSVFIDVFAFATLLFAITGLLLLKMHAAQRRATWPMVGLGLVAPLILALLFIH